MNKLPIAPLTSSNFSVVSQDNFLGSISSHLSNGNLKPNINDETGLYFLGRCGLSTKFLTDDLKKFSDKNVDRFREQLKVEKSAGGAVYLSLPEICDRDRYGNVKKDSNGKEWLQRLFGKTEVPEWFGIHTVVVKEKGVFPEAKGNNWVVIAQVGEGVESPEYVIENPNKHYRTGSRRVKFSTKGEATQFAIVLLLNAFWTALKLEVHGLMGCPHKGDEFAGAYLNAGFVKYLEANAVWMEDDGKLSEVRQQYKKEVFKKLHELKEKYGKFYMGSDAKDIDETIEGNRLDLIKQIEKLKKDNHTLQQENLSLTSKVKNLELRVGYQNEELEQFQRELKEADKIFAESYNEQNLYHQKQKEELEHQVACLEKDGIRLRDDLKTMRDEAKNKDQEIESLIIRVECMSHSNESLGQKLQESEAKLDKLETEFDGKIESHQRERLLLEQEVEYQNKLIGELYQKIDDVRGEHQNKTENQRLDSLEASVKMLMDKLGEV